MNITLHALHRQQGLNSNTQLKRVAQSDNRVSAAEQAMQQPQCDMQVSLPMLAPLLLGTGMLFRSIKSNASFLFPRIGLVVVLMWVLWFANSVVQSTVHYLQRQGALDHRISAAVITGSELFTMLGAGVIVLSALGVNVSGLLLPAGVCLAIAAKDLAHNFLAGRWLSAVRCLHSDAVMHALLHHACCTSSTCWMRTCMTNASMLFCTVER